MIRHNLRLNYRFVLGAVLLSGFLSAVTIPLASGDERQISSLNQLAAPELSHAIENSAKSKVPYLPTSATSTAGEVKTERVWSGVSLPVYSNSFPPMIAQVRTQNWD
jgi:hypothetical protein